MKLNLKSPEAIFIQTLIDEEHLEKIKNPVMGVLLGQLSKLLFLVDSNSGSTRRILNKIKERWNDGSHC